MSTQGSSGRLDRNAILPTNSSVACVMPMRLCQPNSAAVADLVDFEQQVNRVPKSQRTRNYILLSGTFTVSLRVSKAPKNRVCVQLRFECSVLSDLDGFRELGSSERRQLEERDDV